MHTFSDAKISLLETTGHILALGGPGSGKTTTALEKASREIASGNLKTGQSILFLSFARATVSRIAQHARKEISLNHQKRLEINTYHGFAWSILRSHGYLLRSPGRIRLLPPPEASSMLAEVPSADREAEKLRLFDQDGLLHFDIFARLTANLFSRSKVILHIFADAYPTIILDEFQDTNADEWSMIQLLGQRSRLIALADPEQRIYEFRGADPRRISEFANAFNPSTFDFGMENHRSNGTDILQFANDLLSVGTKGRQYTNVTTTRYGFYGDRSPLFPAKAALIASIRRLHRDKVQDWSVAILVPSKKLMLQVSDYLAIAADNLPLIHHDVAFDADGPSLAATLIAALLEPVANKEAAVRHTLRNLVNHIRGRNGPDGPPKTAMALAVAISQYLDEGKKLRGKNRLQIIDDCNTVVAERAAMLLSGDPGQDWLSVRSLLLASKSAVVTQIADDAKYLRLLRKGAALRSRLGELWRSTGGYAGAADAVHDALLQEHFSATTHEMRGVHVMTLHKSKGKEFDEVIIFEGRHVGRIVRGNATDAEIGQSRLSLRVGVTRARRNTTIVTPSSDPCPFL